MERTTYRKMAADEEQAVITLVTDVFNEFVAQDYEEDGIEEFFKFANSEALIKRLQNGGFVLVAEHDGSLVGALEYYPPDCIAMLFVTLRQHGIAKGLMSRAIKKIVTSDPTLPKLVVHSSPYAVPIYEKMGFCQSGDRQKENGIDYIPMELALTC
ncbi:MAG: GNAT family N-acetyltransferase [Magnetovibrio sp.]|nr:GNAT family N-acetyltransferase [Magnetovibrio sp.]